MTRESALLGLIADLYNDRELLQAENQQLRSQLRTTQEPAQADTTKETTT